MHKCRILLAEHDPSWQKIWRMKLDEGVRRAKVEAEVTLVETFHDTIDRLEKNGPWDLLVTDLGFRGIQAEGLVEGGGVVGTIVVELAQRLAVPCIPVSGTSSVTRKHVTQMLKLYNARYFFDKGDFEDETFISQVQEILARTVFVSYSHQDERYKEQLVSHLRVALQPELVDVWNDDNIGAGEDFLAQIRAAIARARVAILLVTHNSLNSRFILEQEVPQLRSRSQLTMVPVIATDCAWRAVGWLARMQVRPKNGKPVWEQRHPNKALKLIAQEVANIVRG